MFDLKSLKITKKDSFVGIRYINNVLEFCLPYGFDEFPEDNFNEVKKLFFNMYNTFKKFERDTEDVIIYSKIKLIDDFIESYHNLSLYAIERRLGVDKRVDYSKFDQYLHKAIYLPNNMIYIEEMDMHKQTIKYKATSIVELYCFILFELQSELKLKIDDRVKELANRFREQYLNYEQYLFDEESSEATLYILKYVLNNINKQVTYKDNDYCRLYEAVKAFLYGEFDSEVTHKDGVIWGINGFSYIWEDMCNVYALNNYNNISYIDTHLSSKRYSKEVINNMKVSSPYSISFSGSREKRNMRPDLVISNKSKQLILDWKYMDISRFEGELDERVEEGVTKQLCYEFVLQQFFEDTEIESQFVIPYYGDSAVTYDMDSGIKIIKGDFLKIQNAYLAS